MKKITALLRLARPANIVTAVADILAGFAVAYTYYKTVPGTPPIEPSEIYRSLTFLILSTIGLYGGGVVMNDVADYELDKKERPERPLPSGVISRATGAIFGIILLIAGIVCGYQASKAGGNAAVMIALLALLYDFFGKHHSFFGPLNMGLCRGGNLLLGMCAYCPSTLHYYSLAIIPIVYIAAITMISRGEVVGGNKKAIAFAANLYGLVIGALVFVAIFKTNHFYETIPFLGLFSFLIYKPLIAAYKNPEPMFIRKAVKAGVLSLIVMDALLATCFMGILYGLLVLALLPVSLLLARIFTVT